MCVIVLSAMVIRKKGFLKMDEYRGAIQKPHAENKEPV
jgi:hypothetical protein